MIYRVFFILQRLTQKLTLVLMGAIMCLGLMQSALQAAPLIKTESTETLSQESLSQKRAERREAQSKASRAANTEENADSIEEALNEKLNVEEIAKENGLTGDAPDKPN
ncbi:MAG: hypothetical protein WA885_14345 [Phormidesmis sp.]